MKSAVRSVWSVACDGARVARDVGSHAAWWIDYLVGGKPRQLPRDES